MSDFYLIILTAPDSSRVWFYHPEPSHNEEWGRLMAKINGTSYSLEYGHVHNGYGDRQSSLEGPLVWPGFLEWVRNTEPDYDSQDITTVPALKFSLTIDAHAPTKLVMLYITD